MYYTTFESPIGPLLLAGDEEGLKYLNIRKGKKKIEVPDDWVENEDFFSEISRQLEAYFAGKLKSVEVKLAPEGTEFQKSVWRALYRAVGLANNRNPISIIVPCHRVIGTNGKLTGYASGLDVKEFLLRLEENNLR